jgi:hypothetical protein
MPPGTSRQNGKERVIPGSSLGSEEGPRFQDKGMGICSTSIRTITHVGLASPHQKTSGLGLRFCKMSPPPYSMFDAVANATIRPLISRFRANLEEPASSLVRRYIGTRSPCMFKYRIADRQMARCRSLIRKCIQQLGNYSQSHLSS